MVWIPHRVLWLDYDFLCALFPLPGEVNKTEMFKVISSLNSTASYFGDAVMSRDEVETMVEDIFRSDGRGESSHGVGGGGSLGYADSVQTMVEHPVVNAFVSGS